MIAPPVSTTPPVCFPPQEVPLRWVLNVVAFDGERVPGEFRHKSKNQE